MDQIFNSNDVILAQSLFDNRIASKSSYLPVNIINQFPLTIEVRISKTHIWFTLVKHVDNFLIDFDKHTIECLFQTQEIQIFKQVMEGLQSKNHLTGTF